MNFAMNNGTFAPTPYGGWVKGDTGTGAPRQMSRVINWASTALLAAACSSIGTGTLIERNSLNQKAAEEFAHKLVIGEGSHLSSADDLKIIREVLSPSISSLAATLGVTRQSIYNWLKGDAIAEENAAKLSDLAAASRLLKEAGVEVNARLLKRKFANGKTLLEAVQAGESATNTTNALLHILRREALQRERMNTRFAVRNKSSVTSDFDLPPPNDILSG